MPASAKMEDSSLVGLVINLTFSSGIHRWQPVSNKSPRRGWLVGASRVRLCNAILAIICWRLRIPKSVCGCQASRSKTPIFEQLQYQRMLPNPSATLISKACSRNPFAWQRLQSANRSSPFSAPPHCPPKLLQVCCVTIAHYFVDNTKHRHAQGSRCHT